MIKPQFKEEILDIYSEKPNFGKLKNKTHKAKLKNPICGDIINVELIIQNDVIKDAKYTGNGCVISTISASLLTEKIKGMKIEEVNTLTAEDINSLLGTKIISTRIKCALLPLEAIKKCLR